MFASPLRVPLLLSLLLLGTAACDTFGQEDPEVEITDLVEGTGAEAVDGMDLTVHYVGWLEDGRVFQASRDTTNGRPGEPISFTLGAGDVIAGWDQGLEGMRVGGKRQLRIPPELAYGSRGIWTPTGWVIPPDATINFEVDLLEVAPPTAE